MNVKKFCYDYIVEARMYPDIDKITRSIGLELLNNKELEKEDGAKHTIDITDLFPKKYNEFDKKVIIVYQNAKFAHKERDNYATLGPKLMFNEKDVIEENNVVKIMLHWPGVFKTQFDYLGFSIFKHEITHALDFLEYPHSRFFKNNIANEKRYGDMLGSSNSYYNDNLEFSQIANTVMEYRRKFPNSWKKIDSYDGIMKIIKKHGMGYFDFDEKVSKDKAFRERFKRYLFKFDLLPPIVKIEYEKVKENIATKNLAKKKSLQKK